MIPPRPRQMNRAGMPGGWWNRRPRPTAGRWWRRLLPLAQAPLRRLPLGDTLLALVSLRQLACTLRPALAGSAELVAIVTYRGEAALLDGFLLHHRRLGVARFVFLDLSAERDLAQRLAATPGCTVWRPRAGVASDAERALAWGNALRHRHAAGRWCLSIDVTDLFVFARCETRPLRALTDFLETEHRGHLYALVIETYSSTPPLESAGEPLFDPCGYVTDAPGQDGGVAVRGGPRRRTTFRTLPAMTPPIDRVPLVRWRRHHAYLEGTRRLRPSRLNAPHAPWHSSPTACLLRLGTLTPDASAAPERDRLCIDISRRYRSSDDLVECGLLNPGQWF